VWQDYNLAAGTPGYNAVHSSRHYDGHPSTPHDEYTSDHEENECYIALWVCWQHGAGSARPPRRFARSFPDTFIHNRPNTGRALAEGGAGKGSGCADELKHAGGLLIPQRTLSEKIVASPVPVIIYVTPGAAVRLSRVLHPEAADVLLWSGTNTGQRTVMAGADGRCNEEKMKRCGALMRSVSKRARNLAVAEARTPVKAFTEGRRSSTSFIDVIASDQRSCSATEEDGHRSGTSAHPRSVGKPTTHSK